ncbi:golgin subfamily A member 4-like isoform X2 [Agrilus planipennis]|uniref:Golgin subfamily A member 4-like isoform X2 n=1 Tax=Agrilus planipennis TaxID=224129 RepID=A0A1W4WVA6_AGRPL|nr:golgin subfamily A member 4-like isoform X2 [Agrilus planipennis]
MDKTPKAKHNKYPNNPAKPADSESPMQLNCASRSDLSFDYSPILSQCTSDNYDVDVIWDWNSPRAKTNMRRGKRQHAPEQEKPPLKKTPSGNNLPTFDQLKKKLDALKEEINAEKNEKPINSSYIDFDHSTSRQINSHNHLMEDIPELEELFNDDSFEEQLILCGQKVENYLIVPSENTKIKTNECEIKKLWSGSNNNTTKNTNIEINDIAQKETRITNSINVEVSKAKKFNFKSSNKAQSVSIKGIFDIAKSKSDNSENKVDKPIDDSFNLALAAFENDEMDLLNEVNIHQSKTAQHCFNDKESLSKAALEEIERKRKEALAKLEAKRKVPLSTPANETFLKKCSPEKIEQSKTIQNCFNEKGKCLGTDIEHLQKSSQFRKAISFDDSFSKAESSRQSESLSKEALEEIERKRKEALAKLEAKKKTSLATPVDKNSLIKCSPRKIEQPKATQDCFKERSKCLETGIEHLQKSPQFKKTTSFDDSFLKAGSRRQESLSKETLEEIEKNRKEALAKLEAKKKTSLHIPIDKNSLIKCLPQQIEQSKTKQDCFNQKGKCLETGIKHLPKSPQFRKTASFDDSFLQAGSSTQESLSKKTLDEIERKRKEALTKLETKRKTPLSTPVDETSPIKCSPEEIEQKRLQALAKREAKRKQEIIERNRLEALKRLEINKKKKALELQNAHRTAPKTLPYKIAENNR